MTSLLFGPLQWIRPTKPTWKHLVSQVRLQLQAPAALIEDHFDDDRGWDPRGRLLMARSPGSTEVLTLELYAGDELTMPDPADPSTWTVGRIRVLGTGPAAPSPGPPADG